MDDSQSVTEWIGALRQGGDDLAAHQLWQRYFQQLVTRCRQRINRRAQQASDEEDIALSVMDTLFRGISTGKYPDLNDREGLWGLLLTISERRATRHREKQFAQKRGGGRIANEAALEQPGEEARGGGLQQFAASGPTPEFAAIVAEEIEARLDGLEDATLRRIAELDLEGYSAEEIKQQLGLGSVRTVFRKRNLIRAMWEDSAPAEGE